uniref:Putative 8.9 kDa family member n=1 Tax=Rhipicephalus pulchellus TaxID=72859 RepID=L7MCF8_RHIPC
MKYALLRIVVLELFLVTLLRRTNCADLKFENGKCFWNSEEMRHGSMMYERPGCTATYCDAHEHMLHHYGCPLPQVYDGEDGVNDDEWPHCCR